MNMNTTKFPDCVDHWLDPENGPAAIVLREFLVPVEGADAPVFPPTFASTDSDDEDEDTKGVYNIDRFGGEIRSDLNWKNRDLEGRLSVKMHEARPGGNVCLMDTVGSQANRLEPLFKRGRYAALVPQVLIRLRDRRSPVNLLDAGHRAADAIVRFSTLQPRIAAAFQEIAATGNAEQLAQIAPTSVLFGAWDSRATQVKLARLLASVIRAYDVEELTRSATYRSAVDYTAEGIVAEELDKGKGKQNPLSRDGMKYALATRTPGGVLVRTSIRRDATLSLAGIRSLKASTPERTMVLQRYILGLGLCALTAPPQHELRQGCHLVRDESVKSNPALKIVTHNGARDDVALDHDIALAFAESTAEKFEVKPVGPVDFDIEHADLWLRLTKEEQKKLTRAGRVSKEEIKKFVTEKNSTSSGSGRGRGKKPGQGAPNETETQ